ARRARLRAASGSTSASSRLSASRLSTTPQVRKRSSCSILSRRASASSGRSSSTRKTASTRSLSSMVRRSQTPAASRPGDRKSSSSGSGAPFLGRPRSPSARRRRAPRSGLSSSRSGIARLGGQRALVDHPPREGDQAAEHLRVQPLFGLADPVGVRQAVAPLDALAAGGREAGAQGGDADPGVGPLARRHLGRAQHAEQPEVEGAAELLAPAAPEDQAAVLERGEQPAVGLGDRLALQVQGEEQLLE